MASEDFYGRDSSSLQKRLRQLEQKMNDPRRLRKGKTLSMDEKNEFAEISRILEQRVSGHQIASRGAAEEALRPSLNTASQKLTEEQMKVQIMSYLESFFILRDSIIEAMQRGNFVDGPNREFGTLLDDMEVLLQEGIGICGYQTQDELLATDQTVKGNWRLSLASVAESQRHPDYQLIEKLSVKQGVLKVVPVSKDWKGVALGQFLSHVVATVRFRQSGTTFTGDSESFKRESGGDDLSCKFSHVALTVLSQGKFFREIESLVMTLGIHTLQDVINMIKDRTTWLYFCNELHAAIGSEPLSVDETMDRQMQYFLELQMAVRDHATVAEPFEFSRKLFRELAEAESQYPVILPLDRCREILNIACPENLELLEGRDNDLLYCQHADGRNYLIAKHALPGVFHDRFDQRIGLKKLPPVVAVGAARKVGKSPKQSEWFWNVEIPTLEKLAGVYFQGQHVDGRFFPGNPEGDIGTPDVEPVVPGHEREHQELQPIPRLSTLRDELLRQRVQATFIWDGKEKLTPGDSRLDFSYVEPGHYVVVTIEGMPLEFIVSNDPGKATYAVYNTIPPKSFTGDVSSMDLKDKFGGTSIHWNTAEQWARSVSNTIREQRENPKKVYPVATKADTPLAHFPNEEACRAMDIDIRRAAVLAGKATEPWTVSTGDFSRIHSGDILWSFGGNAHGVIYLDRMAREFGLQQSVTGVRQDLFRSRILKLILWELYPEYREQHVASHEN